MYYLKLVRSFYGVIMKNSRGDFVIHSVKWFWFNDELNIKQAWCDWLVGVKCKFSKMSWVALKSPYKYVKVALMDDLIGVQMSSEILFVNSPFIFICHWLVTKLQKCTCFMTHMIGNSIERTICDRQGRHNSAFHH